MGGSEGQGSAMNETTVMSWMLHTLAGGGLLLLLAWLWTAWMRQPARRLRVAEWAVAASLVLAVLSLGPAWLVVSTPAPASPSLEEPLPNGRAATPLAPAGPPPTAPVPLSPPAVAPPAYHPPPTATDKPAWNWDVNRIASVAAGVYLAVAVVLLGRWLLGWFALRRLLRRCETVQGRRRRAVRRNGRRRSSAELLASRQARAPFRCGVLRPAVVLPAELCETASDEVLRWVFAHELAHLERRDAWSGLLFGLAQALYFLRRGSGGCAARPSCARSIWLTRPRRRPAAGLKITPSFCSPGRPRLSLPSLPPCRGAGGGGGRAASGGVHPIFIGG